MAEKKGINPVVAGVAGAAIGAAAAAGAVALSDKKNRQKVRKFAEKLKVEGQNAAQAFQKEAARFQELRKNNNPVKPKKLKGKTVKKDSQS